MAIDDLNLVYMNLESVISDRFAKYSKYIIQDRALPDARDGLKPVQRRILYAMFKEGNHFNKPYRKSAKSVGVVIGNYHPHGDSSVYEAMVRMSQSFKLNEPLIDMHGNNGSIDGDPAAAMRYTEARLSAIAMNLLENVDKNTVDFAPNFDDTDFEPIVLPAYFPNLLVNGSTGISAGYATDIPSHNLAEVIDATVHRINNPACDLSDILEFVKGPDFCTGGIIQGAKELEKAYRSGKGRIVVRSKVKVEVVKNIKVINIYELPYDVNKADLVRKLEEIKYDKIFDSIIAVRDESDRDGLSIIIELKKQADENLILNYLYKNTNLQVYYNFNMVAIVNKSPKLLGIIEILDCYIAHQKDVLTKKTMYELELAKARLHIVEGLIKSIDVIDEIITIIRASENRSTSAKNLVERFDFTKLQAEAIVDLRLYRLSNTDINTLNEEFEKLTGMVKYFNSILSDVNILNTEIINKMLEIKEKFKKDRMTAIETDIQEIVIDKQQLITDSEVMISISRDGYIKRATPRSYSSNSDEIIRKENDFIICINSASTLDKLVVLFDNGTYGFIPVFELIETKWKDFGKHISNYVSGINGDKVINAFLINDFNTNKSLISVTKNGNIKQTSISEFEVTRYSKALKYINLKNDDVVVSNRIGNINDDVILMSKKGYVLRYSLTHVSPTSLKSAGIKAMRLTDDELVSIELVDEFSNEQLFVVFENGNTKRMRVSEIMINNRATKGNLYVKAKKTNVDNVLSTHLVSNVDTVFVLDSLDNVTLINPNDTNFSNNELGLRKSVSLADNDYLVDSVIIEDIFVSNNDKQENSNVEKIDSNKKVVDEIKEEKVKNDTNKSDLELELESLLKDEHKEEEILEQVQLDFNDIDL